MNKNNKLPIFLHDSKRNEIFQEVISVIPKNTKIFIVGGAVRNALYYQYFKKELPQRDFDVLLIGNAKRFIDELRAKRFRYGKIRRKHEVVLKRKKFAAAKKDSDFVCFDIHISKEKNVQKNLRENANFTINGFILPLKDVFSSDWHKKIIALPKALNDLKNRQLRINAISHPAGLYACIRFMSQGFQQPSKKEVERLLLSLKKLPKYKFEKNLTKLFNYVGGKRKAQILARKLGIQMDIFDFQTIKDFNP